MSEEIRTPRDPDRERVQARKEADERELRSRLDLETLARSAHGRRFLAHLQHEFSLDDRNPSRVPLVDSWRRGQASVWLWLRERLWAIDPQLVLQVEIESRPAPSRQHDKRQQEIEA